MQRLQPATLYSFPGRFVDLVFDRNIELRSWPFFDGTESNRERKKVITKCPGWSVPCIPIIFTSAAYPLFTPNLRIHIAASVH